MIRKLSPLFKFFAGIAASGLLSFSAEAQAPFKGLEHLFTPPENYVVNHTDITPKIDGDLNDAVWQKAGWTNDFVDIEGDLKPKPALPTKAKMLWDDSCLYIAAQITDPQVWATLKKHDDIIFRDNDFEVFIDPNNTTHHYFELEFNALNTVFDLFLNKPYRNLGNALINWNAEGLRSAVKVRGTLNDPNDTDQGWTIEIAIPFRAISIGNNVQVPQEGSLWRINFSRVEWDTKFRDGEYVKLKDSKGNNLPEHNWVWSAQGVVNMHYPERWGYLQFSKSSAAQTFTLPYAEEQKQYLWLIYYREKEWYSKHGSYAPSLQLFDLTSEVKIAGQMNNLVLEATAHQFMAFVTDQKNNASYTINQEGLVTRITPKTNE
jgi:hypothetical protein